MGDVLTARAAARVAKAIEEADAIKAMQNEIERRALQRRRHLLAASNDGASYNDIAAALGVTKAAVQKLLAQARAEG